MRWCFYTRRTALPLNTIKFGSPSNGGRGYVPEKVYVYDQVIA